MSSPLEISGWLIFKMAARLWAAVTLAKVAQLTIQPSKMSLGEAQFRVECGGFVLALHTPDSDPSRSLSSRRKSSRKSRNAAASTSTGTTGQQTALPLADASSCPALPENSSRIVE